MAVPEAGRRMSRYFGTGPDPLDQTEGVRFAPAAEAAMTDVLQARDLSITLGGGPGGDGLVLAGMGNATGLPSIPAVTQATVVKGVTFRVRPGTTVALLGEAGAGRSLITRAVIGSLPTDAIITDGALVFHDPAAGPDQAPIDLLSRRSEDVAALDEVRGRRLTLAGSDGFQALPPWSTLGDLLAQALAAPGQMPNRSRAEAAAIALLTQVGCPSPQQALGVHPWRLPRDLRWRAMLALALASRPALLLAGSPDRDGDLFAQRDYYQVLNRLQDQFGMAVLLPTADPGIAATWAWEVVVLHQGEVVESGRTADVFGEPRHPYLKALLRSQSRPALPKDVRLVPLRPIRLGGEAVPDLIRPLPAPSPPSSMTAGRGEPPPLLTVSGLTCHTGAGAPVWFDRPQAQGPDSGLNDFGFELERGQSLAVVGGRDDGLDTLAAVLTGALRPERGTIAFDDQGTIRDLVSPRTRNTAAVITRSDGRKFRVPAPVLRRIQYLPRTPGALAPDAIIGTLLREPAKVHRLGASSQRRALPASLLAMVGLDPNLASARVAALDDEERLRLTLARVLAAGPELVIMFDPTAGLDISDRARFFNLVVDVRQVLGFACLFLTYDPGAAGYLGEHLLVIQRGRVVERGTRATVLRHPAEAYTQSLLAAWPESDPSNRFGTPGPPLRNFHKPLDPEK
ncbi:putative ABC transporter ATP-binding protein [uncultured Gammaproteobacteria bacterium]